MTDTTTHLFYGYTAIALILAAYIWSLSRRVTRLMREEKQGDGQDNHN